MSDSIQCMLAGKVKDVNKLRYPVLASYKLDGVRAFIHNGVVMSRSFKPIPNVHVQRLFGKLAEGLDGELILGDPTAADAYRRTVSAVMSDDGPEGANVTFHVFDKMTNLPFHTRLKLADEATCTRRMSIIAVVLVKHFRIETPAELLELETAALDEGHEGVMVRDPNGPYKYGRSSEREGWLLKLKRFVDSEAVILGTIELMHNANVATKNELGHTHRSTAQAGKVGRDTLGKFQVRDLKTGVEFECGTGLGLTMQLRDELWRDRHNLVGQIIKYKYFPSGGKDKPRHPVWLGFRDARDMDAK